MARVRGKATASRIWVGLMVLPVLLVTGCGALSSGLDNTGSLPGTSSPATSPASPATLAASAASTASGPVAGPGPQAKYHVQPQPAPGTCHYVVLGASAGDYLPDPHCTPGATNPKVTQANLASTICKSGYTATIRPPVSYTNALKRKQMRLYGESGSMSDYQEDHLISLEIGRQPDRPAQPLARAVSARLRDGPDRERAQLRDLRWEADPCAGAAARGHDQAHAGLGQAGNSASRPATSNGFVNIVKPPSSVCGHSSFGRSR